MMLSATLSKPFNSITPEVAEPSQAEANGMPYNKLSAVICAPIVESLPRRC